MTSKRWLFLFLLTPAIALPCVAQGSGTAHGEVASAHSTYPVSGATHISLRPQDDRIFHVGTGDVLNISVWDEPQLSAKAVVRPDGYISMPLVDEVQVGGLTPEQIQNVLTERVARVVKHPRVSVVVEEIHSRIVYITGEVQHPGAYPLTESIDVLQLIARSGGLTEYAHGSKIFLLRHTTGQKLKVDYNRLLKGRNVEQNVALLPGDMVVIP